MSLLTALAGLGGLAALHVGFQREFARLHGDAAAASERLRLEWDDTERARHREWPDARSRLEEQLGREVAERRAVQAREIDIVLGGPVARILKDPDLTLSEMLRRVALACAAPGAEAVVRVEHFTEFDLVVSLRSLESPLALADTARCILGHGARYLNSLRFTYDTNLLLELGRQQIESVGNWSRLTRDQWWQLVRPRPLPPPAPGVPNPRPVPRLHPSRGSDERR